MEHIVEGCKNCLFLGNAMGVMECHHPYWRTKEGKGLVSKNPYEYCVITQSTIYPPECPLKKEPITIKLTQ